MSEKKIRELQLDEARATGSLIGMTGTMLIYHENGVVTPDHWARLREVYDALQVCHGAVIDCLCEPIEQVPHETQ